MKYLEKRHAQLSNVLAPQRSTPLNSQSHPILGLAIWGVSSSTPLSPRGSLNYSPVNISLFSVLLDQTLPSGHFSLQPWSIIKGLLWSGASQLKTLHKLSDIIFYSALFQHLNNNIEQRKIACAWTFQRKVRKPYWYKWAVYQQGSLTSSCFQSTFCMNKIVYTHTHTHKLYNGLCGEQLWWWWMRVLTVSN